jgi:DNA-binding GntR family transcriptional regulator
MSPARTPRTSEIATAPPPNSAERAYLHIRGAILGSGYASGARLPEEQIAGELGVSRTPVRDALRRLQSEGLVEFAPNVGARVATWTEAELSEIAHIRALLEGYAAELAAQKITREELAALEAACDHMERAAHGHAGPDLDGVSKANLEFHGLIAAAARNTRLRAALEPLWHFPLVIRKFALFGTERLDRSLYHHREILAALTAGDPDWAGDIMRSHIRASRSFDSLLVERET